MTTPQEHWNAIFTAKADAELGWYEADVSQSLKFVADTPHAAGATVLLPGAGTSVLVDALLERGFRVVANDVSDAALAKLRARLAAHDDRLTWLHHDVSTPFPAGVACDMWIDRAVLHFLMEEAAIEGYFANLRGSLRAGGHALLAQFAPDGSPKCAGLPVMRYSVGDLAARLGADFELVRQEEYTFMNPYGSPKPYVYGLFRRK